MRYWWLGLGLVVGCGPAAVEPEVPAPVAVEAEAEPPMEEVVAADGTLLEVPPDLVPYILTPEAKQEIIRQANQVAENAEALTQEASAVATNAVTTPTDCEANTTETYPEWQAGTLVGEDTGSRVRVRPAPDLNQKDGSYGLVGEAIAVMAQHDDGQCQRWYRVQFPESGWQGWVHGDHVQIEHGSDR
jgi:hypothetical protein